jgi:CHAT domain-containing protein
VSQKANNQNPLLGTVLGAVLGIVLAAGVPEGVLAQQSAPVVIAQSGELEEAERLTQQVEELYQQGKYREAIPLVKRILEIREKALGPNHPDVAEILNNLALLYLDQGNYAEAEPLLQRSLTIREKTLGNDHPLVGESLNNLAELYRSQGNYAEAEPLYQRSLAIYEKVLGPDHIAVATSLNNQALLYYHQGNYAEAEPLYQRSLAIREKVLGADHPLVALSLNNLGLLYYEQGNYAEAEPLYQRSLAIYEKALRPDHPDIALPLNNLAELYRSQGNYAEAEPLYVRSLTIWEKALGPDYPRVALSLNNLANLYYNQGNYAEAESLSVRSLAIWEKALGPDHPRVALALNNLAALYDTQDDIPRALQFATRALTVEETNIALNLALGSERRKRAYMETLSGSTNRYISLHLQSAPDNLQAANLALTAILQRKGRILDAVSNNLQTLRENLTPENRALLEELSATRSQIASVIFAKEPPPGIDLPALERTAEQLKTQLAAASAEYRVESEPVTIEAIQELIPDDAALVELIYYYPRNSKTDTWGFPRYAAYVLHSVGDPQWVDLGEAAPIDELVGEFRKSLRWDPQSLTSPKIEDIKAEARALDQLLMEPVRPLLKNKTHILLSPDSQLNLIPFASLVDEQNRFLVETHTITYLTSGRDLLKLQLPTPKLQPPLILGNIDFDNAPTTAMASNTRGSNTRSGDLTALNYKPLPGTQEEIEAIAPLLPNAALLEGAEATESAITETKQPQILHLATHGFFFKGSDLATEPTQPGETPAITTENPLLRSGLALAGFNSREEATSSLDGVLTALEVTALNLRGTQLVVLSACETALGDVANGDGVYGLRRAFTIAGAESQLMSLWKVSDSHTQEMMVGYYQRLKDGMGRSEAMRDIQLEMLKEYEYPFYWASFIPVGNWEPMEDGL